MDQKELFALEQQCIQECAPPCTAACPVHVDVRAMLAETARGDFSAALKIYQKAVPFPNILSRICDQPCQNVCRRGEIEESIAIRALERAAVNHGELPEEKKRPMPKRSGDIAVIGGGISGLTVAYDLARKGYKITIYEAGNELGGGLWKADRDYLPAEVIREDVEVIYELGVEVDLNTLIDHIHLVELRNAFDAVYIAVGPHASENFELERDEYGVIKVDPITFETSMAGVFAGGGLLWGIEMHSSVTSISEGRRAGISIDRYLQKVSVTASRLNEGPYTSCLYTDISEVGPRPLIEMHDPDFGYEWHEAIQEAKRCIQCECMECVKACEYLREFGRYPRRYVREIYNNLSIVKGTRYANTFINSCSLCGLCAEICPENLDMGTVTLKARQTMVVQNRMPASAHDFGLRDMQFSNSDKFLLVRNAPGTITSDYVLFPGCQLSASSPEHVERVYDDLRQQLPNQNVGLMLGCCGAPANWAGRPDLFESILSAWHTHLQAMGNPKVILPCSSCYQVFQKHLPEVEIISLWDFFDTHGLPAEVTSANRTVSIHDPCSTRYESHLQDSIRHILGRLGYQIDELSRNRERTTCCSYGGMMWLANPNLAEKVVQKRIQEGEADYVTYCAMCRDNFAGQGKRTWHILDLIYNQGSDEHGSRRGPTYSQRHENRARLKRHLLTEIWGETMDGSQPYESIRLSIAEDVQAKLEQRLILIEDIQRVIEYAERTRRRLLNRQTGHYLAYYKPTTVTYWVEYMPAEDGFTIFNAYSHRMEVPGSGSS